MFADFSKLMDVDAAEMDEFFTQGQFQDLNDPTESDLIAGLLAMDEVEVVTKFDLDKPVQIC